ncbi:lymphoid-specific helicase [Rhizoctonia solani]|uniref:Lymphoid-specific helicase n=1 Tax=Rhizoctonia solani TaxID=456999 RepID=A0A8H8P0Y5_9AGAM|nr:lymphoid-specific helicase [Rhizoctonia solani]QRW23045.1 lymphoid-specific helicase [Rhizoctonia solani]
MLLEDDDDTYFDALQRGDYDIPEETEEERRKKERDAAKKQTIQGPDSDESVVEDWLVVKGGKILLLKRMSDELLKRSHKVLIFSQFKTVQQWLTHCKDLEHC